MAGIGFELKRLFKRKGVFASAYAYGYAFIVCCGPMILGMVLLLGVGFIARHSGLAMQERELLNAMITVSLLAGLTISSLLSLICTRYIADMLYQKQKEKVMPSFWGVCGVLLTLGAPLYGLFLFFAGIPPVYCVLNFLLFGEVVVTWTEISYLTAIKDYKGIFLAFAAALAAGLLLGWALVFWLGRPVAASLLFAMAFSYAIMAVWYLYLLLHYFPAGRGGSLAFLRWLDKYPSLVVCGLCGNIGLFAHLVLFWLGSYGTHIQGLYYHCPGYDLGAVFGFISILITTVNYVVSVETKFYPCYRDFYALYNDNGTLSDIELAGKKMLEVLSRELSYAAVRQVFTTTIFLVLGSVLFEKYPIGFTEESLGVFRVLCIGYGLYAIGNTVMLSLLYFADNKGAALAAGVFAAATVLGTVITQFLPHMFMGTGFVLGALGFLLAGWLRLRYYTATLSYHLLSRQPVIAYERRGFFTKLGEDAQRLLKRRKRA